MADSSQQGLDRIATSSSSTSPSAGGRPVEPGNLMKQTLPPKEERVVSVDSHSDAAISGPLRDVTVHSESFDTSGALAATYPYEGYDNTNVNWNEYSQYVNANGLQVVPPAMYHENPSLLFHSGYGFDPQMAYGQFSPIASPMPPMMMEGQLFPSHQIPVPPSYYPQPVSPNVAHVTSAHPSSQTELLTPGSGNREGFGDNMLFGPSSGYFVHFGSFGGGDPTGSGYSPGFYRYPGEFGSGDLLPNGSYPSETGGYMSPLTSSAMYPQPIGILGSYEHNVGQIPQQQRPFHGVGSTSSYSTRRFPQGGSYQSSNYGSTSISQWGGNQRNRVIPDKGGRKERDRDSICVSSDGIYSDNRGPRASKQKGKSSTEESSLSFTSKNVASASAVHFGALNHPDFATNYEKAKFFVIKSFSEDNVHKSIKYHVWASTPLGNRKLDAAYLEAKEMMGGCPVFLLFSVNTSGQFCGVAEMVGHVDFEKNADYWQQDRWSGQFPVKWHFVKDVPNSHFRHILVENNDNKPVTHSRDCQEVKLEQGIEILKIFKEHDATTSILDDFEFYDDRERALQERKARQQASSIKNDSVSLADSSVNLLSDSLAKNLQLEDDKKVSRPE